MTISHQINPVFINPARLSTTSCQYIITYNPVFIDPAWLWTISRQHIFGLRHWNYALINHWVYYSNSQHGWISIMVINNQYYDQGFQSRFSAMAIILSMDMIYSTIEGIVPSCCRLTTRHLGATLFKLRLHQICKSHDAASMHHDTWGLMQSHFLLILLKTQLITL